MISHAGTGYWMTANGWCVNGNGKAIRGESKKGLTQDECFKYCEEDPSLSGCTYDYYNNCITYTGDVTGCNGHGAYKCHYRTETRRKSQILLATYIVMYNSYVILVQVL